MSGFRAPYHDLTLLVVSEFNEWKVMLYGPDVTIQGIRQFTADKAKEHALAVADHYLQARKHEDAPSAESIPWIATGPDDWLIWTA